MVVFVTMKSVTTLLALLIQLTLFAQIDTIVSEDQILKRIEIDQPSEPIIRFGKEYINLLGKWCYSETDGNSFVLSKTKDSASIKGCHEISLGYWGFVVDEMNRSYSVTDSVFQFHFFRDTRYFTKSYSIRLYNENQLVFVYQKTAVADQPNKQISISLGYRFDSDTTDLSLDRIFSVWVDSISYRGDMIQLMDSAITFHAYFVDDIEKDSIYWFPLNKLSGIDYCTSRNPGRFFQKNRIPSSKREEIIEDAIRVCGHLSVMSILALTISGSAGEKSYTIKSGLADEVLNVLAPIGLFSGFITYGYYSIKMLYWSSITDYYDLTDEWFIR